MAVKVRCPGGCLLKVPAKRQGEIFRCPRCKADIRFELDSSHGDFDPNRFVDAVAVESDFPVVVDIDIQQLPTGEQMIGRIERARQDRKLLSRFLAVFLFVIGAINIVPALYHWHYWAENSFDSELPAWIYIQILIAMLFLMYSLFLWQTQDWSALKAVAVVALIFSAGYGFVVTSLLLGGMESELTGTLGIYFSMFKTAMVWCIAMLLVSIVTCWLSIKEALNWQHIEKMFDEISLESTVDN